MKHEIKKQEGGFLGAMMAPMAASLIAPMASLFMQPVASSLINAISGKGQEGGFLPLLALPLMMKVLGKGVTNAEKDSKDLCKYEKLENKNNKLKLDIGFLNNCKQLCLYPKILIFKLTNVSNTAKFGAQILSLNLAQTLPLLNFLITSLF